MECLNLYIFGVLMIATTTGGLRALGRCKYSYSRRMYTANCVGINLEDIPNNLKEDIQVLLLSENRIRDLFNHSFAPYSSLKWLDLSNNFINFIEAGTFMAVPKLEVLDLRINGVSSLPAELPLSLNKLYLDRNRHLVSVPLSNAFNLEYLSIGGSQLSKLPNFGFLPNLNELNLTGNSVDAISAEQLAPLCRLKVLHVPEELFSKKKETACQCHEFSYWTNKYSIFTNLTLNCTELSEVEHELCLSNRSTWFDMRQECLARTPPFSLTQTGVVTSAGIVLLVVVLIILCCLWRRTRRKRTVPERDNRNHQTKISTLV